MQRMLQRHVQRVGHFVFAFAVANRQQRAAGFPEQRLHGGKVHLDYTGPRHKLCETLHGLAQYIISCAQGHIQRKRWRCKLQQFVIGHHHQCVAEALQLQNAGRGHALARMAFPAKWRGDNCKCKRVKRAHQLRNDRNGAAARAAAHAARQEHQISAQQCLG